MSGIKLIIFDLDGTIIDSLDDLTDATNYMLFKMGKGSLSREQVKRLVGQGARRLVERAVPGIPADDLERALSYFISYNDNHIVDKTRLYPNVTGALMSLRESGCRLAIISNKNSALCRKVVSALGVEDLFEVVMGADTIPFRKPSPEPVLKLLGDFGVNPDNAVIIGDSINDVAAGKAAGVLTVGCTYGYGELSEVEDADYLVGAFAEILDLPIFAGVRRVRTEYGQ
jgi:phosphoglycolate phosphatase